MKLIRKEVDIDEQEFLLSLTRRRQGIRLAVSPGNVKARKCYCQFLESARKDLATEFWKQTLYASSLLKMKQSKEEIVTFLTEFA